MEYLRGYRLLRQDPEWTSKLLVGSVLVLSTMCIPIIGQVCLTGWAALTLRQAVLGRELPLPRLDFDLNYLGKLVGVGFKAFIVRFLWTLPVSFLAGGLAACIYFGAIASAIGVADSGGGASDAAGLTIGLLSCGGFILLMPLIIVLSLPAQIAGMRAEMTDDMNSGLAFGEVIAMTRLVFRELFVGTLVLSLFGGVLTILGMLACYVGMFPAMIVLQVTMTYFHAQVYSAYLAKGGQPLRIASPDIEQQGQPQAPIAQQQPPRAF